MGDPYGHQIRYPADWRSFATGKAQENSWCALSASYFTGPGIDIGLAIDLRQIGIGVTADPPFALVVHQRLVQIAGKKLMIPDEHDAVVIATATAAVIDREMGQSALGTIDSNLR